MKLLLLFLALVACGIAYYEYTWQQQTAAGFPRQIQALQAKVDTLAEVDKKMEAVASDLNQQLSAALRQEQMSHALQTTAPGSSDNSPSSTLTIVHGVPLMQPVSLGTVTTLLGKTYQNVQLLKAGTDDITVSSDDGISQIPLAYLAPDLQKKLGYDAGKAEALRQAEIRYQEQLRAAKAAIPGQ